MSKAHLLIVLLVTLLSTLCSGDEMKTAYSER